MESLLLIPGDAAALAAAGLIQMVPSVFIKPLIRGLLDLKCISVNKALCQ